jgi:sporulation protein YlmC with PRC-barrel domain
MAHLGTLKDTRLGDAADDIRGSHLYGLNDEKLGKIDDVIFDHSTGNIRYVVVDTGGWLSSRKFLVPAEGLRVSAKHDNDFEANLDKRQIENFPPYNESDLDSESKWAGYEGRYRSKWVAEPVMHRAETDRNITPTPQRMFGNPVSEQGADATRPAGVQGRAMDSRTPVPSGNSRTSLASTPAVTERAVPAGTDSVVISNSAVGIGGRWVLSRAVCASAGKRPCLDAIHAPGSRL